MAALRPVRLPNVDRYWPAAQRLLSPAIERTHGEDSAEIVFNDLMQGKRQLWLHGAPSIAAVTKLQTYETGKKTAVVMLTGGEGVTNLARIADIELWAAFNDCQAIEIVEGRLGLKRFLPGYEIAGVHYIKEL